MAADERHVPYKAWLLINNMILKENEKLASNTDRKIYILDKKSLSWGADRDFEALAESLFSWGWEDPHDS